MCKPNLLCTDAPVFACCFWNLHNTTQCCPGQDVQTRRSTVPPSSDNCFPRSCLLHYRNEVSVFIKQITESDSLTQIKHIIPVWHLSLPSLLTAGSVWYRPEMREEGKRNPLLPWELSHGPASLLAPSQRSTGHLSAEAKCICLWSLDLDLWATLLARQPILPAGNKKKKEKLCAVFFQLNLCSSRLFLHRGLFHRLLSAEQAPGSQSAVNSWWHERVPEGQWSS